MTYLKGNTMTLLEDQMRTPAGTAMPGPTRQEGRAAPSRGSAYLPLGGDLVRVHGDLAVYRIIRRLVAVPGRRPKVACHDRREQWLCTRPDSHRGRHAQNLWHLDGRVRAVWGVRATAEKTA